MSAKRTPSCEDSGGNAMLRIPGEGDQRSGVIPITIPG